MLTRGKAKGWLVALGNEAKAGEGKAQEGRAEAWEAQERLTLLCPEKNQNPGLPSFPDLTQKNPM